MKLFKIYKKTEKSSELKWDHIHLKVLDDKICIPKQDFLNLVSNIEYLQENQKDEIFEEIIENTEAINEDIKNINENNISNVESLIPKTRSFYNQEEAKKSIVSFCYLFAGLKNKFANSYKLDIGFHLGTSYRGIDILSNAGWTYSFI
ncbi:hypothetical protein F8M41_008760 [Gigaspora margarita]|uniref:Uncharacterized protein n=1 Tax=Gigaspora margarita TaxID=4874 RepID=A0A8H3X2Y2_GIGMA|nr:hypothetical protein F8M41_008760 [Gigaspora margarita]